jgi:DNA-binding GntR family transcriptional regulator
MTVATRVLDELRRCSVPLDDDQLAKRLGISQRQQINQVCRRLEAEGHLRRYVGADGKIVNDNRHFEDDA